MFGEELHLISLLDLANHHRGLMAILIARQIAN